MADEPTPDPVEDKGISEDELRGIFNDEVKKELDARGLTAEVVAGLGGIGDFVAGLFEENKPGDNSESLLEKIGTLIDEKLKGLGNSGNGKAEVKEPRKPKLNVFGS